jgi:serine/threonine protein kinase
MARTHGPFRSKKLTKDDFPGLKDMEGTTLQWAAPELFTGESGCSPASDVYSLGVVFWELLTLQVPGCLARAPASPGGEDDLARLACRSRTTV